MPSEPPDYRVYKARRGFLRRLFRRSDDERFADLDKRKPKPAPKTAAGRKADGGRAKFDPLHPERHDYTSDERRRIQPGRIIKWVALACLGWALLSLTLFMISAHNQSSKVPEKTKAALDDSGNLLTSANNILVLGSDKRKGEQGRGRADTIMLMRYGGGKASRLSIPRDTLVDIPGYGPNKINAAYALGGAPLMIETVKQFLDIEINHIIEINFKGFPKFVDSMGGINMTFDNCVRSRFEGRVIRFKEGENHLDGEQALDAVRIRNNECDLSESDLTRARRQQKFLESVKSRLYNPFLFPRWPWIGWRAPQAIQSDLGGPGLMALYWDMQTSGSLKPQILEPVNPAANPLEVSEAEKQQKVQAFLDG